MISIFIHKEDGMEDLHGHVRVHGGGDLRDIPQIAINEFTQTNIVFHCAASTSPTDVEFKLGDAEGVLHIDQHQPGFGRISGSRLQLVKSAPSPALVLARSSYGIRQTAPTFSTSKKSGMGKGELFILFHSVFQGSPISL